MNFLQSLQKVKTLLRLSEQNLNIMVPGQIFGDVDTQEPEAGDILDFSSTDVDGRVSLDGLGTQLCRMPLIRMR